MRRKLRLFQGGRESQGFQKPKQQGKLNRTILVSLCKLKHSKSLDTKISEFLCLEAKHSLQQSKTRTMRWRKMLGNSHPAAQKR